MYAGGRAPRLDIASATAAATANVSGSNGASACRNMRHRIPVPSPRRRRETRRARRSAKSTSTPARGRCRKCGREIVEPGAAARGGTRRGPPRCKGSVCGTAVLPPFPRRQAPPRSPAPGLAAGIRSMSVARLVGDIGTRARYCAASGSTQSQNGGRTRCPRYAGVGCGACVCGLGPAKAGARKRSAMPEQCMIEARSSCNPSMNALPRERAQIGRFEQRDAAQLLRHASGRIALEKEPHLGPAAHGLADSPPIAVSGGHASPRSASRRAAHIGRAEAVPASSIHHGLDGGGVADAGWDRSCARKRTGSGRCGGLWRSGTKERRCTGPPL